MINFGVIGYGYWGPNIVRNLGNLEGCSVTAVCDQSPAARKRAQAAYPHLQVLSDPNDIMTSPDIDAVAVITPVWTHYELAKAALENGKHVFVEKPFTSSVAAGRGIDRAGGAQESEDHGGPHVPVHRCGQEDQAADR